jgi:hypothetical protein
LTIAVLAKRSQLALRLAGALWLTLPRTFIQWRLESGVRLGASQRLDRFSRESLAR